MKTIKSLLIILLFTPCLVFAQDPTCDCEESYPKDTFIVFCPFDGVNEDGYPIYNPISTIFTVRYVEVLCPGQGKTIQILGTTLTTSWFNFWNLGWIPNSSCPDIHPNDVNDFPAWDLWRNKMFARLFSDSIAPWNSIFLSWRGGCNATMTGKWPSDAYISTNDELTGYTQHSLGGYDAFFTIPCNNTPCCLYKIEYDTVGLGHEIIVVIENDDCDAASPSTEAHPFISTTDENGETVGFRPVGTETGPCRPMCAGEGWSASLIVEKKKVDLKLKPSATRIPSIVQVSSSTPVEKVVIYNMKGEQVLETNVDSHKEIDLSKLSTGMYLMQVYFEGKHVKSIKIYKEN